MCNNLNITHSNTVWTVLLFPGQDEEIRIGAVLQKVAHVVTTKLRITTRYTWYEHPLTIHRQ